MKQVDRIKRWVKIAHPALNRERLKKELEVRLRRRDILVKKRTQTKLFTEFDFLP